MLNGLFIYRPYPPLPVFFYILFPTLLLQAFFKAKNWRLRRLLPIIGCIILLCALLASLLLPPPHVFGGRFWLFLTVALPGGAILCGAGIGNVVGF